MRRGFSIMAAQLLLFVGVGPASALGGGDTMNDWRNASETERSELLKTLPDAARPALRRCMDETAKVTGHADLPIAEVAKVCAKSEGSGQPV